MNHTDWIGRDKDELQGLRPDPGDIDDEATARSLLQDGPPDEYYDVTGIAATIEFARTATVTEHGLNEDAFEAIVRDVVDEELRDDTEQRAAATQSLSAVDPSSE